MSLIIGYVLAFASGIIIGIVMHASVIKIVGMYNDV
jgi:ABC-type nitrate/sulfonate/bicarbonate transport system permease component